MAHVGANDELISENWIVEVERIVGAKDGDVNGDGDGNYNVSDGRGTRRVPEAVVKAKADAYAPQIVSVGPYYYSALKDAPVSPLHHGLSSISQMEMHKLKCLKAAARNDSNIIHNFLENKVLPNKSKLEEFYNWKLDTEDRIRRFGWMMTVDAFFLYHFLHNECDEGDGHDRSKSRHHSATGSIKCDIVKLENQLPLFLLDQVHRTLNGDQGFDEFHRTLNSDQGFDKFLKNRVASLCSFEEFKLSSVKNVGEEQHLLAYMYKCVSSFLEMEGEVKPSCCQHIQSVIGDAISTTFRSCCFRKAKTGPRDFKVNARKLVKHGITLTPFALDNNEQKIRFNRYSGTLYLPRLIVSDMFTEVVLRNLLALEFIETNRGTVVTQYVELMKSLIDTAKDVKALRKQGIIVPGSNMISDDYIAAMWKDISKPFFAASVHPSSQLEEIKKSLHRNFYIVRGKAICINKGICLVMAPIRLVKTIFMPSLVA